MSWAARYPAHPAPTTRTLGLPTGPLLNHARASPLDTLDRIMTVLLSNIFEAGDSLWRRAQEVGTFKLTFCEFCEWRVRVLWQIQTKKIESCLLCFNEFIWLIIMNYSNNPAVNSSVVCIQSCYRGFKERKLYYNALKKSAIVFHNIAEEISKLCPGYCMINGVDMFEWYA
ncbi:hypothetical protein EON65_50720 [archaeon]|nr:MAG: hypothetical protein EON65_50720 [archaeon]